MNLKSLSNEVLDQKLESLVKQEREILSEILYHIYEVDQRKLYLKMAYPSLFKYLTERMKYSNGSAQRRIDAARLMKDVPNVIEKLDSGELNLTQVSLMQTAIRQKRKETSLPVSKEQKQELVEQLASQDLEGSQKIIAQSLDLQIQESPKVKVQKDESVRLEVTFTKEQWEKLQEMRELLSTALPNGSWDQVLEHVADKVIAHKKKEPKTVAARKTESQNARYIPAAVRRFILKRDKCCQHKDPNTDKQCASKWNLQVDHIQPVWAGGTSEPQNLRALCANHNRYRCREQANLQ